VFSAYIDRLAPSIEHSSNHHHKYQWLARS
jgi:hypothetical protein